MFASIKNRVFVRAPFARFIALFVLFLLPIRMYGAGWTPTDAGFVLNFESGDQFLLSVWIDLNGNGTEEAGEEFFVCDYPSYNGGRFNYKAENYLKLVPQAAGATTPSPASVWTIREPISRISGKNNYSLGGISYTMWGNSGRTLYAAESPTKSSTFKFLGYLTDNENHGDLCDVVIVVPSNNSRTKCMDPNNTLGRAESAGGKFNSQMGTGFAGMVYREVYLFDIPRANNPVAYTNASLVTFNTSNSNKSWSAGTIKPGFAAYAFADSKHDPTTRTLFRLYVLNEKKFVSCNSYFFGWDVQDYTKYRQSNTMTDSTSARKIYALDHFVPMERVGDTKYYQTAGTTIPSDDSTYYYVGKNNTFFATAPFNGNYLGLSHDAKAVSAFKHISNLRIRQLKDEATPFVPSKNAYGYLAVDTTVAENNLGVSFEPAGYFFQTNTGTNVRMSPVNDSTWMVDDMWYINPEYMGLQARIMLYTGAEFSATDPGAVIEGWSVFKNATEIPVVGGGSASGQYGWARIHTNRAAENGGMEFVVADKDKYIHYDYNGHFGAPVPNTHPEYGKTKVAVQAPRLLGDYKFICWTDVRDTTGLTEGVGFHKYNPGDSVTLSGVLNLYAQAVYEGSINLAISFVKESDGKRYFLTHPGTAPRFARARTFTDWTDVYQGMSDAENSEPNYLSTYKMIVHPVCELCAADEVVLDPHHETMHGSVDSLTFYEYWTPASDEFIGLYYASPNTVIANNTWAGIFKSTTGRWPTPANPCVENTKIYSTDYFTGMETGVYTKNSRGALASYIKYNSTDNQFDGDVEGNATNFMISGVGVVDEHYVILPDTTNASTPWRDVITFDAHNEVQHEQVWSKLIGKQLLAQMKVGDDTIYFHPNRDKTFNTANELRLSNDYRLRHEFEFLPDQRAVVSEVDEANRVTMEETENAFCCNVYSGAATPIADDDIVDTLRVWLRPSNTSKIKAYYGRWKKGEVDSILADGSRYNDILIRTKTYHYGAEETRLILKPEQDSYSFGALASQSQTLNFLLLKETSQALLDAAGTEVSRNIVSIDTIKSGLDLTSATCSLKTPALNIFTIGTKTATTVTLSTQAQNEAGAKNDTLTVTVGSITISDKTYSDVTAKVPLTQSSIQGDELVWSVVKDGKRYFIMAGSGGLIFREYNLRDNTLYKLNSTTALIKGSVDAENSNNQYITPWTFAYTGTPNQLTLQAVSPVSKYFAIDGTPTVGDAATALTYEMVRTNANSNANYEEVVKLKVDASTWLKFNGTSLETTTTEGEASTFYWGYLQEEYNLLNNGAYPSVESLAFGYNNGSTKSVQTRYKAFSEYSMLLDNTLTYLCRSEVTNISALGDDPWNMSYTITKIADGRTFDAAASSGLGISTDGSTLVTTVTPASATSPTNVTIGGAYVDIVDTLEVSLSTSRTDYRFTNWEGVSSIGDAHVKIPLIRKTYHSASYDSIFCAMEKTEYNFAFPSSLRDKHPEDSLKTFHFETVRLQGTNVLDVDGNLITSTQTDRDTVSLSGGMDLNNPAYAEIRLVDEYGQIPSWCEIESKTAQTITVRCKSNGVRAPRTAYLYFAYIVTIGGDYRYVNFKLTVSQASLFQYANNQTLIHTSGASGDPIASDGRQQAHENRRILYYYNPKPYDEVDQNEELPVRERGYYGWWRWYREGKDQNKVDVGDTDIPDSVWVTKPRNVGKYNYPFRIIGDSVMLKKKDGTDSIKVLVTMGRYTVFHYPSKAYGTKLDPPSKNPMVKGPWNKDTVTYVVDISNYYDNLPLSMAHVNQIDTAVLDTMKQIIEPTLSLREVFELHPWTEMAQKMEGFKSSASDDLFPLAEERYMEDHEVMAPIGNRLLLRTEQRYNYKNLEAKGHTESLLGYYMRDDNWSTAGWSDERKDTMIWCGGWDADCEWYTYDPSTTKYTKCNYSITVDDDFLNVPAKAGIAAGQETETLYYCLRSRSRKSTHAGTELDPDPEDPVEGDYWFNICRYKIIYHDPRKYGPIEEKGTGSTAKAIIPDDEIEQNYEILERLNFDYVKPGKDYHIYPHPLPWADASYGYSYPVTSEIPNNRYHDEKDFPGPGEYAIINKIPYSTYWRKIEQHGGAANGYMIYCDGMSSSGQVAALTLSTHLCEGQKMYFSGYIGNVSNQSGKSNPNFTISVQGSNDGTTWRDITSYMTGDIQPSDKWYQIFFPINQEGDYDQFRIRIYNVASDFDGNDFVIDDMCVFATKPPLIAYQADTKCVTEASNDSLTNVVLRVDYQGFVDKSYNSTNVYYTVQQSKNNDTIFVPMVDKYFHQNIIAGKPADGGKPATPDTIYGYIRMPSQDYMPSDTDFVFTNLQQLVDTFETSYKSLKAWEKIHEPEDPGRPALFRQGYLYENLDGVARPVLYVIHQAKMTADYHYTVRLATDNYRGLLDSKCAVTSNLNVSNRMVLELNGEEVEEKETDLCANSTYDMALRIKGSLLLDSVAPIDVKGSCINDWLLYGDTAEVSSKARYGYKYSDIKKVITKILRCEPVSGTNANQFARTFSEISKNELVRMQKDEGVTLSAGVNAYNMLDSLVSQGFLTLYQSNLSATVAKNDSVQYMIFPILGTGTNEMNDLGMEVCPTPILIQLKPSKGGAVPMMVGGIQRDSTELSLPVEELVNQRTANDQFKLRIDSIMPTVAIHSVKLLTTDDPNCLEGVHLLNLEPDRIYDFGGDNSGYYKKGDSIVLRPAASNNYTMQQGYNYTFGIVMQGLTGSLDDASGCPVGVVPFTLGIVPDYLRWAPQSKDNNHWNDPNNWIGVDDHNDTIPFATRFAPIASTDIIIPAMTDGMPYPEVTALSDLHHKDSIREVNFVYDKCDDIRFLPGAAMGKQQNLTCDATVVDMIMPYNTWALRAAPLTGMLSGDIFMSEADLNGESRPWYVGSFDANGRNYKTGNATYWLSFYDRQVVQHGNGDQVSDSTREAAASWSKFANSLTESLAPTNGWAVYARTKSTKDADVRLPKSDDIYYYYYANGDRSELNESGLRALRDANAGGSGKAGKFAFQPTAGAQSFALTNGVASTSFVFGNPTMGFIDIWGFIADNSEAPALRNEIMYIDASGSWQTVTKGETELETDTINNPKRYLPPMHAMVVKVASEATEKAVTLNADRVVTSHRQVVRGGGGGAPRRSASGRRKGIMTVTAINPLDAICKSRLLIGQGYHDEVLSGEDAMLTTVNLNNFSSSTPSTPFNIYAANGGYGLSIDLRDSIVNVPISFSMTESLISSFDPITNLWFTGVNSIDGQLVLYDALMDTERPIIDGICLTIETPELNHQTRYYIRRPGYTPYQEDPVLTGVEQTAGQEDQAVKIVYHGNVYILRNGHVYTMFGQKVR